MKYYHASETADIKVLEPSLSSHGVPLVYFSRKRENVLVYLSNAIKRYCKETGFEIPGKCATWGPYGFTKEGILQIQEYYPDALYETYKGASAYIYTAEDICEADTDIRIPDAAVSAIPVPVTSCEFVPDAYEAIMEAAGKGLISIGRYEELIKNEKFREWNRRTIRKAYADPESAPEYKYFIEAKFGDLL